MFCLFFSFPVKAQRPNSLSVGAPAGGPHLWTTQGDGEVRLRMAKSGLAAEKPLTINDMFTAAVKRFGDFKALSWTDGEQQKSLNYKEYYQTCRTAAKSFLKVRERFRVASGSRENAPNVAISGREFPKKNEEGKGHIGPQR